MSHTRFYNFYFRVDTWNLGLRFGDLEAFHQNLIHKGHHNVSASFKMMIPSDF
jgi:hypothetical protein